MTTENEEMFNRNIYLDLDFWFRHELVSCFSTNVQGLHPDSPVLSLEDELVELHHGFFWGGEECLHADLWGTC